MKLSNRFLQNSEINGFDIERKRKQLLEEGKRSELLTTYNSAYPSIPDGNTGVFWDQKFSQQKKKHYMEEDRNRIISEWILKEYNRNEILLDLGVGKGYIETLIYPKLRGKIKLVGTDITTKTLTELRRNFPDWTFIKSKLFPLSFTTNSFDLILLLEVLEHIKPSETFRVLKEIYRVLKTDGVFIMSVPINEGLEEMFPDNPNQHLRVYSEELIRFELETVGFKINRIVRLTAFSSNYTLKKVINNIFKFRESNNLIIFASKN